MNARPDPFSLWHIAPGVLVAAASTLLLWWLTNRKTRQ